MLVHCWAGESRSVATLAAYLLKHRPDLLVNTRDLEKQRAAAAAAVAAGEGLGQGAAAGAVNENDADGTLFGVPAVLQLIRRAQPRAAPNAGFREQLE